MFSITPVGNLIVHRAYVVMGVMAEFSISSWPEYDNQVEQDDRRLSILSIIGVRFSILGLVVPIGRPRYVNGIVQYHIQKCLLAVESFPDSH
jgi:hypothetical protein